MENVQTTMAQLLQALMEDCRTCEQSLTEERAKREQELQEEHCRYDEALTKRDTEMQQQMELLRGLVEGLKTFREPLSASHVDRDREIKVTKLTEADNIEAYLTTFEHLMQAYEVPQERWAFKLAPQLVGKAQQAYAAINADDAKDYAILRRQSYSIMTLMKRAIDNGLELLQERKERLTG